MNSQEIFPKNTRSGFTLIELLLVIAIIAGIGLFSSPISISFYHSQLINETSDGLVSALRLAQSSAISGKHEQTFGVRILAEGYVIFEGDTYETRNESEDLAFPTASSIEIIGLEEVSFSKFSGLPSNDGTIVITSGAKETEVSILSSGHIER